jgi:carboxynorspermidine decarboxylase
MDLNQIPTPCYVCEEALLENNLKILDCVQKESGAKILLALKGYSMFSTFPQIREYLHGACASGLWEAKLAREEFNREVHTFSPAFIESEIDEIIALSDHIVFNSLSQYIRFKDRLKSKPSLEIGIRVNPEYSEVSPIIYNPCAPFSRLGVTKINFKKEIDENPDILDGISGLHFHTHCEQNSDSLERTLKIFEEKFGEYIPKMKWINFGGGHHITREDYDIDRLIKLIVDFKARYGVNVYLEPGEAIGWKVGSLIASVIDIVHNKMDIAILDRPDIRASSVLYDKKYNYKLGTPTCLAGDIIGDYSFDEPLKIGDKLIFEDMIHYTFVKNNTFNGIKLPSLGIWTKDNKFKLVKKFSYEDYKSRLS